MWTWRGVQISTDADLLSTMSLIVRAGTTLDAMELIDDYASCLRSHGADDPYRVAQDNLGYLIGYLPRDNAREVYEFFELVHPMLGAEPWNLSDEEIVKKGMEHGGIMKRPISKATIPPTIEQRNTIEALCEKLKIAVPVVENEADARFVIDDLRYRQRRIKSGPVE